MESKMKKEQTIIQSLEQIDQWLKKSKNEPVVIRSAVINFKQKLVKKFLESKKGE
jgi:hypothetical protein